MVVQCYWALVNASVDVTFAKKNFGLIVAGAQIGSILGPTVATQAGVIGIPILYLFGASIMFMMVAMMYFYVERFGAPGEDTERDEKIDSKDKKSGKEEGILEGFYLMYEHDYVKGIFCISSLFMMQVTIIDYMMKILAKERYANLYPDDPQAALRGFASFMGYFGQVSSSLICYSLSSLCSLRSVCFVLVFVTSIICFSMFRFRDSCSTLLCYLCLLTNLAIKLLYALLRLHHLDTSFSSSSSRSFLLSPSFPP